MLTLYSNMTSVFCFPAVVKSGLSRPPEMVQGQASPSIQKSVSQKILDCWHTVFSLQGTEVTKPVQDRLAAIRQAMKPLADPYCFVPIPRQLLNPRVWQLLTQIKHENGNNPVIRATIDGLDRTSPPPEQFGPFLDWFMENKSECTFSSFLYSYYCKSCQTEYSWREILEKNRQFFSDSQEDLYKYAQNLLKKDTHQGVSVQWSSLSLKDQADLSNNLRIRFSASMYSLEISNWHPTDSFESFMNEIRNRGPLSVTGRFRRASDRPPYKTIENKLIKRQAFILQPEDFCSTTPQGLAMILIVGAKTTHRENFVYYLDPIDLMDTQRKGPPPIYEITYETLTAKERIANTYGLFWSNDYSPKEIGYAFCRQKV